MLPTNVGKDDDDDDEIIFIRDFEPKDLNRVKFLFQAGMLSHVPTLANLLTRHRLLMTLDVAHPLVLAGAPAAVTAALALASASASSSPHRYQSNTTIDSGGIVVGAAVSSVLVYLGTALVSSLGWWAYHSYYLAPRLFADYIQYSMDSDLANIPSVYQTNKKGNDKNGAFLVAVSKASDTVVGMVGAEFKHHDEDDENEAVVLVDPEDDYGDRLAAQPKRRRHVYEIRRLSVGPETRGKGVGRRLLQALQERVPARSRLFADCSNIQPTAQRLYAKAGFGLTYQLPLQGWPAPFQIWRYEKDVPLR